MSWGKKYYTLPRHSPLHILNPSTLSPIAISRLRPPRYRRSRPGPVLAPDDDGAPSHSKDASVRTADRDTKPTSATANEFSKLHGRALISLWLRCQCLASTSRYWNSIAFRSSRIFSCSSFLNDRYYLNITPWIEIIKSYLPNSVINPTQIVGLLQAPPVGDGKTRRPGMMPP